MSKSKGCKAAALSYNTTENDAPVVLAAGYGMIAKRIIDIAENKGIPIYRDDSAASLLCMLEMGSTIPPGLYEAVAAVYGQLLEVSREILSRGALSSDPATENVGTGTGLSGQDVLKGSGQPEKTEP